LERVYGSTSALAFVYLIRRYNGRELGQQLSKCILDFLDLSYLTEQVYTVDELPPLYMPLGMGGFLPGGIFYYNIRKINWTNSRLALAQEKGRRRPVVSDNVDSSLRRGLYIHFDFDQNGLIEQVSYFVALLLLSLCSGQRGGLDQEPVLLHRAERTVPKLPGEAQPGHADPQHY